jgi:predicted negative regulator of RcsB-dependent stress response
MGASTRYMAMVAALERGDESQALVLLGELERESPGSPYTDQAKLMAARIYVNKNELDKAAQELDAVVQHSKDGELATVGRLRLARVRISQGKPDEALGTLKGLDAGAFATRAHEIRGDAYFAKGDKVAALGEYRQAQGGLSGGSTPLLDLKIADLSAAAPPAAGAPTTAPK